MNKIVGTHVGFVINTRQRYLDVVYDKAARYDLQRFSRHGWVAVLQDIVRHRPREIVHLSTDQESIRRLVMVKNVTDAEHIVLDSINIGVSSNVIALATMEAPNSERVMLIYDVDADRAEIAAQAEMGESPLEFQSSIAEVSKYQDRVAPSALLLAVSLAVIGIAVDTASLQRRLSTRRAVSLRAPVQVGGATPADRIEVVSGATEDMVGMPVTVPQARRVSVLAVDENAQIITLTAKLLPVTGGGTVTVPSGTQVAIGDAVNDLHFLTPDRIGAAIGAAVGATWMVLTLVQMVSVGGGIFKPAVEVPEITLLPSTQPVALLRPTS